MCAKIGVVTSTHSTTPCDVRVLISNLFEEHCM